MSEFEKMLIEIEKNRPGLRHIKITADMFVENIDEIFIQIKNCEDARILRIQKTEK